MALNDRRSFLKMTALAGACSTNSLFRQAHAAEFETASRTVEHLGPGTVAQNEDYWSVIQRSYSVSTQIINTTTMRDMGTSYCACVNCAASRSRTRVVRIG